MNDLETLKEARANLERLKWTKGHLFGDKEGNYLSVTEIELEPDKVAECCALGALALVLICEDYIKMSKTWESEEWPGEEYLINVLERKGFHSVTDFNDAHSTKKLDVLEVYDEAIELAAENL